MMRRMKDASKVLLGVRDKSSERGQRKEELEDEIKKAAQSPLNDKQIPARLP